MKPAIPVIVEDIISKVTNEKLHHDQKQHYAKTLEDIVAEGQKALRIYETHRNFRK